VFILGLKKTKEPSAYDCLASTEKPIQKLYKKLDNYQQNLKAAIEKYKLVFVDEPAGTGKTTITVMTGVDLLRANLVDKLIYVRFPSKRSERLGATPGDLAQKEAKYMLPFYEALTECGVQEEGISLLTFEGLIETMTDVKARGRNLKGFIIIDEAQNAEDLEQLKLILTRIHDHRCRTVVIGHSGQTDSKVQKYGKNQLNAFQVYQAHMTKKPWAVCCQLFHNYRGELSQWADKVKESLKGLE
jgi:PhoH-like ATPase